VGKLQRGDAAVFENKSPFAGPDVGPTSTPRFTPKKAAGTLFRFEIDTVAMVSMIRRTETLALAQVVSASRLQCHGAARAHPRQVTDVRIFSIMP
jgi:hypothetical protein